MPLIVLAREPTWMLAFIKRHAKALALGLPRMALSVGKGCPIGLVLGRSPDYARRRRLLLPGTPVGASPLAAYQAAIGER